MRKVLGNLAVGLGAACGLAWVTIGLLLGSVAVWKVILAMMGLLVFAYASRKP